MEIFDLTQEQTILRHLQEIGGLSAIQCSDQYRITNLSGRISDLRKEGHNIVNIPMKNEHARWVEYRLEKEAVLILEPTGQYSLI